MFLDLFELMLLVTIIHYDIPGQHAYIPPEFPEATVDALLAKNCLTLDSDGDYQLTKVGRAHVAILLKHQIGNELCKTNTK